MHPEVALGVDIGGSHITAALVETRTASLSPHSQCRIAVDSGADVSQIIGSWAATIRLAWEKGGVAQSPVGIAMPGPFDYEEGICLISQQDKYRSLYGLNIRQLLAKRLGISPNHVLFINDASSFLKGELVAGSVFQADEAIGITLGTGLGSAHYRNQHLYDADLWQMPFMDGIAEDWLSTRWFVRECQSRFGKVVPGVKELVELSPDIPGVAGIFSEFAEHLAMFIEVLQSNLLCSNVVIGGNIAKAADFFWQQTMNWLVEKGCTVNLRRAQLGEQAAIIGAASLFAEEKAVNIKIDS